MKKVLFLHSSSELYGSDRSLLNLVKRLDKSKFEVSVILPEDGPLVDAMREVPEVSIIIQEIAVLRRKNLSFKGIFNYVSEFIKSINFLRKIIKEKKIDIVYTNTSVVFPGGIIAKLLGKKSIWHIREIISNNFERKIVSIIVNLFSDIIIANSQATANAITRNNKKVTVVYNAIESSKNDINDQLFEGKENIVIGMAGRINRWKGQKLFVDMAEQISYKHNNVKFLIAGDVYKGEDHILKDLKKYIKEKDLDDKVILLGQIKNMDAFYNSLDIFILPSIQPEPFGLVVIEAMDRKIPVIATNHGGPTEIIDNEINGYLVDFLDAKEMSEKVSMLIENEKLRKEIGDNAKKKRDEVFTLDTYVNKISEVINSI